MNIGTRNDHKRRRKLNTYTMNSGIKKIILIIAIALSSVIIILGVLAYYQKQGLVHVFPNQEDRAIKKALEIDESKFVPPQGTSQEVFQGKIQELRDQKKIVLQDTKSSPAWFTFGKTKEFLNDHEGAVLAWEIAFKIQQYNFVTAMNLANNYQYFIKDYPKAELYYNKALELRPDFTSAYEGLMDLYRYNWKEKNSEYESLVLKAIEKDSANTVAYTIHLVEFFASEKTQNIIKAKEYLSQIRKLKQEEADRLLGEYPILQ